MAYLVVNKNGAEQICEQELFRWGSELYWSAQNEYDYPTIELPKGSIEKLIGKKLTWEDEPVELKEKLIETNQRGV